MVKPPHHPLVDGAVPFTVRIGIGRADTRHPAPQIIGSAGSDERFADRFFQPEIVGSPGAAKHYRHFPDIRQVSYVCRRQTAPIGPAPVIEYPPPLVQRIQHLRDRHIAEEILRRNFFIAVIEHQSLRPFFHGGGILGTGIRGHESPVEVTAGQPGIRLVGDNFSQYRRQFFFRLHRNTADFHVREIIGSFQQRITVIRRSAILFRSQVVKRRERDFAVDISGQENILRAVFPVIVSVLQIRQ